MSVEDLEGWIPKVLTAQVGSAPNPVGVGEEVAVGVVDVFMVVLTGKSPVLYRIQSPGAAILLPLKVKVCVPPYFAPSLVYATVVTTVLFKLVAQ